MKKLKSITAVLILMLITVSACGKKTESDKETTESDTMISESEENEAADNALTETAETEMIEKESEENGTADSAADRREQDRYRAYSYHGKCIRICTVPCSGDHG